VSTAITHWINGQSYSGQSQRTANVFDPATGKDANVVTAIVAKAPDTVTERQMGTDKLLVVLGCFHP
jgi:hypothetical protein